MLVISAATSRDQHVVVAVIHLVRVVEWIDQQQHRLDVLQALDDPRAVGEQHLAVKRLRGEPHTPTRTADEIDVGDDLLVVEIVHLAPGGDAAMRTLPRRLRS